MTPTVSPDTRCKLAGEPGYNLGATGRRGRDAGVPGTNSILRGWGQRWSVVKDLGGAQWAGECSYIQTFMEKNAGKVRWNHQRVLMRGQENRNLEAQKALPGTAQTETARGSRHAFRARGTHPGHDSSFLLV